MPLSTEVLCRVGDKDSEELEQAGSRAPWRKLQDAGAEGGAEVVGRVGRSTGVQRARRCQAHGLLGVGEAGEDLRRSKKDQVSAALERGRRNGKSWEVRRRVHRQKDRHKYTQAKISESDQTTNT